ncbi:Uncharacterised protein [uncultured archaeon]|nr:Uncharacterised protein [uncultured archaeon]
MKISKLKRDKIAEQILAHLYTLSPSSVFTSYIAKELARDEEFTKKILTDLKKKKLVLEIKKNPNGVDYLRRSRWKLTPDVFEVYKKKQAISKSTESHSEDLLY